MVATDAPVTRPNPIARFGNKRGTGTRKGVRNKVKAEVADIIKQSLDELGGVAYLVWLAKRKPEAYASLLGRVIPRDVRVSGGVAWLDVVKAVSAQASVADASGPARIAADASVVDATAVLVSSQLDAACKHAAQDDAGRVAIEAPRVDADQARADVIDADMLRESS